MTANTTTEKALTQEVQNLSSQLLVAKDNLKRAMADRDTACKLIAKLRADIDNLQAEKHAEKQELEGLVSRLESLNNTLTSVNASSSALDTQKGGDHYSKLGEYQPWVVCSKWMKPAELKGFMKGTVIAYLAREEDKGGDLDIEKAYHTLGIYLELKSK